MQFPKLNKKIRIILTILVVAILIIVSFGYWYIYKKEEEDKYMTVKELFETDAWRQLNFSKYKEINIKDKVVDVQVIKLPKMEYNITNYSWVAHPKEIIFLTKVNFESNPKSILVFFGNQTENFTIGKEIEMSFPVGKYYTSYSCIGLIYLIEPIYWLLYMVEYMSVRYYYDELVPIKFTKEFSDNNTTVKISLNYVTDFYPFPFNWSEIYIVLIDNKTGMIKKKQPEISIYNSQNYLIGHILFKNSNITNDEIIKKGDYLLFDYILDYNNTQLWFIDEQTEERLGRVVL